jgi:hypothetical protein
LAELWHADDAGEGGALGDAIDAAGQGEALGEIGMDAECRGELLERTASRRVLRRTISSSICSIRVRCSASGSMRGSGAWRSVGVAAVQAAMSAASILSFLARCRRNSAKARTWRGWKRMTAKPSRRNCRTTSRSYPPLASMPTRSALCRRSQRDSTSWPSAVLSTCRRALRPCSATSSLYLPVSIPAATMLVLLIFLDPSLRCEPSVRSTIRVR